MRQIPAIAAATHLSLPILRALLFGAIAFAASFQTASAQSAGPILISHEDSTRALAFESVTQQREPFSPIAPVRFGSDNQTRVMLFVMNLTLQSGDTVSSISVTAEDAAHQVYQLPVEFFGNVPEHPWATSLVVRLGADMNDLGDVLLRV